MITELQREDGIADYETAAVLMLHRWGAPLMEKDAVLARAVEERLAKQKAERVTVGTGFQEACTRADEKAGRKRAGNGQDGGPWWEAGAESAEANGGRAQDARGPIIISASPFIWRDPATFPQRAWLYGRHHIRKFLTSTVAPGGGGKTSLTIVEALAMTTARPLLGITPAGRLRVWIWNGEDPAEELDRRIIAAMTRYNINPEDVDGYLFRDTGRDTPIVIATQTRNGTIIAKPIIDAVIDTIQQNHIDVLIVDPFVKSHKVSENDNSAIDAVASQWATIADVTNTGIDLNHHARKTGGAEITIEDSRGAKALIDASRAARVLNRMTRQEAGNAGVEDATAWRYFRVDNGKSSMAPPPERADWYKLESINLANNDSVGVATAWTWPNPFDGVSPHDLRLAQKAVSEGGPWRANNQAKMWVGKPIATALGLDPADKSHRRKVTALLNTWIENGMFVVVPGTGNDRHGTSFIEVGKWAD
jgi:hypothetical protein